MKTKVLLIYTHFSPNKYVHDHKSPLSLYFYIYYYKEEDHLASYRL